MVKPKAVPNTAQRVQRLLDSPDRAGNGKGKGGVVRKLDAAFEKASGTLSNPGTPPFPKSTGTPLVPFTPDGESTSRADSPERRPQSLVSRFMCCRVFPTFPPVKQAAIKFKCLPVANL